MARKNGSPEDEQESGTTSTAITRKNFQSLLKRVDASQDTITEETASMGAIIKGACADQHLHKKAFALFRQIRKVQQGEGGDVAAQELLFHLHTYLGYEGLMDQEQLPLGDRNVAEMAEAQGELH